MVLLKLSLLVLVLVGSREAVDAVKRSDRNGTGVAETTVKSN